MMRTLIGNVFVPGHPRPKGSLDVVNASRKVLADNDLSVRWRSLMAYKLGAAYQSEHGFDEGPCMGRIRVQATFSLLVDDQALLTRQVGDVDKLARNLLDALADDPRKPKLSARVFADDSQVVDLWVSKRPGLVTQGVLVSVFEVD